MRLSIQRRIAKLERSIPAVREDFSVRVQKRMRVEGVSWETAFKSEAELLTDAELDFLIELYESTAAPLRARREACARDSNPGAPESDAAVPPLWHENGNTGAK